MPLNPHPEYREYLAWDAPTRWFHWVNALAVIGLMATGIEFSYRESPAFRFPIDIEPSFSSIANRTLVTAEQP
jgi:Ni,Fe-hydrogenase I cytochrome b subunit